MTTTVLALLSLLLLACFAAGAAAGAWLTLRRRRQVVADNALLRGQQLIEVSRSLATVDIVFAGTTVRTDMAVSSIELERLANGLGKTLVDLPTKAVH